MCASSVLDAKRIARQYWWAWIETWSGCGGISWPAASPASIGGRGLKRQRAAERPGGGRIARQYWWAWIETSVVRKSPRFSWHRPPVLVGVD